MLPGSDGYLHGEATHLHGRVDSTTIRVCERPVAQLPEGIVAPGPDRAIALQRQTVEASSINNSRGGGSGMSLDSTAWLSDRKTSSTS